MKIIGLADALDSDFDDKISFKEFSGLFEPSIVSYEMKGYHMEVCYLEPFLDTQIQYLPRDKCFTLWASPPPDPAPTNPCRSRKS